ncbi:hypothetical protein H2248_003556 [Termitomyces sp. 'cryptogamus']|nr:hypothetical protein H2248_003556 [Termitomyces sp. 'cryptogamus']
MTPTHFHHFFWSSLCIGAQTNGGTALNNHGADDCVTSEPTAAVVLDSLAKYSDTKRSDTAATVERAVEAKFGKYGLRDKTTVKAIFGQSTLARSEDATVFRMSHTGRFDNRVIMKPDPSHPI